MVTESTGRGQVILIGAITLAFIILGIVIVFNGVLFTETISAGDTSQSAATADKIELEVTHGVACAVEHAGEDTPADIEAFANQYQNTTAESGSGAVNISPENEDGWNVDSGDNLSVVISYDSTDLSYEQTRKITNEEVQDITDEQCPEEQ
ncbi:hypothetical protein SAMN04487967_0718 [Natronorubrum sediminis]|uniref:Uncharacterized protein n=1 Tax=Natronorubrum sediminis TaxID=640943 RepID=A0A1H6FPW7_9EURY|nr:hypothetical protein [Natronorubrum sediminis]SEH12240.1 hypothetical protein SAMN04487967_0718 [Natronorubrum sediminis]